MKKSQILSVGGVALSNVVAKRRVGWIPLMKTPEVPRSDAALFWQGSHKRVSTGDEPPPRGNDFRMRNVR